MQSINHLHLGFFTCLFNTRGVTITHTSGRVFRIDDERASNRPHLLQHYAGLFRSMRDEKDINVIPHGLRGYELREEQE
jgi:hypothetical protein